MGFAENYVESFESATNKMSNRVTTTNISKTLLDGTYIRTILDRVNELEDEIPNEFRVPMDVVESVCGSVLESAPKALQDDTFATTDLFDGKLRSIPEYQRGYLLDTQAKYFFIVYIRLMLFDYSNRSHYLASMNENVKAFSGYYQNMHKENLEYNEQGEVVQKNHPPYR